MGKSNRRKSGSRNGRKIGWPQAFRDIVINSMARGQAPLVLFFFVMIFALWRMPSEAVGVMANKIVDRLVDTYLLGWALLPPVLLGWFTHSRWQRRTMGKEVDRLAGERDRVQEVRLDRDLNSSRKSQGSIHGSK